MFSRLVAVKIAFAAIVLLVVGTGSADGADYTIAIVPKLAPSLFYDLVGDGCSQLSTLISQQGNDNVECIYRGPTTLDAVAQAAVIDDLVLQGVHGIAVAVLDDGITGAAVDRAVDAGIPVITFDSDAPQSKRLTTIGTNDNEIGHGLAWLLSLSGPQGGRFAVISSNVVNVNRRVDGLRFKLQESFPNNQWVEFGDATDCQNDVEIALDQAFEIASNSEVNAIVSVGGWPMFNPTRWKQFVNEHPDLLLIAVDSLPIQLELLNEGYVDALLGQRPLEMGKRSADNLYSLISDPEYVPPPQIYTGDEVFIGVRGNRDTSKDTGFSSSAFATQGCFTAIAFSILAAGFMCIGLP